MAPLTASSLDMPDDVEVSWDLDGCSMHLPGPGYTLREFMLILAALPLAGGVFLVPFALFMGSGLGESLWFGGVSALVMAAMLPLFLGLGGVARRGRGVDLRIEPNGDLTYWSFGMEEPLRYALASIGAVEVPESRAPRVVLQINGRAQLLGAALRFRTWEHARAVAAAIEQARRSDPSQAAEVPEALRALRQQTEG